MNRLKEDEKIERIIRGLLKLPENKRCINCNSLGPQYVCTTFFTFVCTNCSGVHREFTHRVKSVSMAKFTAEEVSALQAGGNERARQIYFKEWDPQYHSYPDGSNIQRLRDFIKHVYCDRKYTGERNVNRLPKLRLSEESTENRKLGAYLGGSRSSHDEDRYSIQGSSPGGRGADRNLRYYYDERRSPRYSQENERNGGFKRVPLRFEVVDNRIREERLGRSRSLTAESKSQSSGSYKSQSRSPDKKKKMDRSHSPVVPPFKEILGENVLPLQVGEISIANQKDAGGSAHNQKIKSTSGSAGNAAEHKIGNVECLIDFNTDPEPPHAAENPQPQQTPPPNNDSNWASFESSTMENASQVPKPDTLESLLFEWSVPSSVPAINASEAPRNDEAPSTVCTNNTPADPSNVVTNNTPADGVAPPSPVEQMPTLLDGVSASTPTATSTTVPAQPCNAGPLLALPSGGVDITVNVTDGQHLPSMQQDQYSLSFAADSSSTSQHAITPVGASNGEPKTSSLAPNTQGSFGISAEKPSQSVFKPAEDASSGAGPQSLPVETKYSMREELPADLFTTSYPSIPAQGSGWHTAPPHGMGFNMQYYPHATPVPAFLGSAKPTNPFDLQTDAEKSVVHSTHFPSMSSLQGGLHSGAVPPGLIHTSSLPAQFKAPQTPTNESMMPSQSTSFTTAFDPRAYTGQQLHNNKQSLRPQGVGDFSRDEAIFGSLTTTQQPFQKPSMRYSARSNSDTFSSMRGNPFG